MVGEISDDAIMRLARVRAGETAAALILNAYDRGGSRYMNLDGVVREKGPGGVTIYERAAAVKVAA